MQQVLRSEKKKGFIAILTVVMLLVFFLPLSLGILALSSGSARESVSQYRGELARVFSESCAEDALRQLRSDPGYEGGEVFIDGRSCDVSIERNGDEYMVQTEISFDGVTKRTIVSVNRGGSRLELLSWQEN